MVKYRGIILLSKVLRRKYGNGGRLLFGREFYSWFPSKYPQFQCADSRLLQVSRSTVSMVLQSHTPTPNESRIDDPGTIKTSGGLPSFS